MQNQKSIEKAVEEILAAYKNPPKSFGLNYMEQGRYYEFPIVIKMIKGTEILVLSDLDS